jgi:hypothetical protein
VCSRFETAEKLNEEDRAAIIQIARLALAPFHPEPAGEPDSKVDPKPETDPKDDPTPSPEAKKTQTGAKPKAAIKDAP